MKKSLVLLIAAAFFVYGCTEKTITGAPLMSLDATTDTANGTIPPALFCGDSHCDGDESPMTCPNDCIPVCGDGLCTGDESGDTCPTDCDSVCGDFICNGEETTSTCPADCGVECGNDVCHESETSKTCPQDCDESCGDGECAAPEDTINCVADCGSNCGDGACNGQENSVNCSVDCGSMCGDGACNGTETTANCADDCGTDCGDGACNGDESTATCPMDCGTLCGDGVCNGMETTANCADDCDSNCGDGTCNGDESTADCPMDCGTSCGDGVCNGTEATANCDEDCNPNCGDGACNGDESAANCPADCATVCGDGVCSDGELKGTCPADCGGKTNHTNVVVILFDDLGIGDLQPYGGSKIRTPRIQQMAQEGMRFNNFYVAPWCGPTRSALHEGKRLGHTQIRNSAKPLSGSLPLLAKSFKSAGYRTGMFGKWGLAEVTGGYHIGSNFTIHDGAPESAGFDEFIGFLTHRDAHVHYLDNPADPAGDSPSTPYYTDIRRQMFKIEGGVTVPHVIPPNRYVHDEFADAAVSFINTHAAGPKPFFLYVPFTIPHVELIAPEDEILNYYRSLNWPEEAYAPPAGGANSSIKKRPQAETYATYAAMVERGDRDVGRILQALKDNGIDENTLVLVASDNGPLLGNYRSSAHVDFFDSAAGNRGYKSDVWEGGVSAPLIARWPKTIPASTTSNVRLGVWDIFPTVAEAVGAPVPGTVNGKSFLSVLTQGSTTPLYDMLQLEGWSGLTWTGTAQVVFKGDLKLVRRRIGNMRANTALYDLANDPTELFNVLYDNIPTANAMISVLNNDRDPLGNEYPVPVQFTLPEAVTMAGSCGSDTLSGTGGPDFVTGGGGDDFIGGQSGPDHINGNKGNDIIHGGRNGDLLRGGQGNDTLHGDYGDDILYGDLGDDILEDFDGHEEYRFHLGSGTDTIHDVSGRNHIVFVVPNPGAEQIVKTPSGNNLIVQLQGRPDTVTIVDFAATDGSWSFQLKKGMYKPCSGDQVGQCHEAAAGLRCRTDPKWNGPLLIHDANCSFTGVQCGCSNPEQQGQCHPHNGGQRCVASAASPTGFQWTYDDPSCCQTFNGTQCGEANPAQKSQCHPHQDGQRCVVAGCSPTGFQWDYNDPTCCPATVVQCGGSNPAQMGQCHPHISGRLCMPTLCAGTGTGHRWSDNHPACP